VNSCAYVALGEHGFDFFPELIQLFWVLPGLEFWRTGFFNVLFDGISGHTHCFGYFPYADPLTVQNFDALPFVHAYHLFFSPLLGRILS